MPLSSMRSRFTRWLAVRLAALVLSIAALIMLSAIIPTLETDSTYYGDGLGSMYAGLVFAGNCWTIIYNSIVLGILFAGKWYHPGVDIAMDLIGWGLNWAMGVLILLWNGDLYYVKYECNTTYMYDPMECALAKKLTGIEMTGGIICMLVGLTHMIFFIKGCVETHHLRVSGDRAKFMELGGVHRV